MRRSCVLLTLLVCALSVIGASVASAQDDGFKVTTTDVGPVIGVGGLSGAGVGIGGRFEKGFKELPNLRNGVLGIGVSVDYYSFGNTFINSGFDYKVVPVAVTVNYHFALDDKKIDPFFGVGLGYEHFSISGPSCVIGGFNYCEDAGYSSGIYFVGHAGIRYFWRPKMALYADVGSGTGSLHLGVMFKLD
ncbi:MAG: OmpW family outer membrane protein [Acidobacteriota bacterium]